MGWTKGQFVLAAFEEIGLGDYAFDLSPEQMQSALVRLDVMIGGWNKVNIHWPFEPPNEIDQNTDTKAPIYSLRAIITNLAIEIAPSYGKVISKDTKEASITAYQVLLNSSVDLPPTKAIPQMLRGAGAKNRGSLLTSEIKDNFTNNGSQLTF